jgi:hypothetical protein
MEINKHHKMTNLTKISNWSPVSEGFVGDPWLSITLTLCHILHSVSHWPVLVYYFKISNLFGFAHQMSFALPSLPAAAKRCTLWRRTNFFGQAQVCLLVEAGFLHSMHKSMC